MRTLVVTGYGIKIRAKNGLLLITGKDLRREESLIELEQVVIASGGVSISSKAVRMLIEHGVDLVFLDSRGYPVGRVYPPYINRTVDTRRAQYLSYYDGKRYYIIRVLVESKIRNQAGLLKRYGLYLGNEELRQLSREIKGLLNELDKDSDDPVQHYRLVEAKAARYYWSGIALLVPRDLGFNNRDQDGSDPFNIMLNYGYGILYGEAWRALVLAGLDPYAGYMHVDRSGKPVLVYDYVEMYRPIIDYALLKPVRKGWRPKINGGLLNYESRTRIIKAIHSEFEKKTNMYGEPVTIRQAMKRNAFSLASFIRGETPAYKGLVVDW